jgi:outer membrane lipoprotein SlyB
MLQFKFAGRAFVAAVALFGAIQIADAQQPGTRIRGQIEKADGNILTMKTREGATLQVQVADDARISALEKASLKDIKNDTFIGIAGTPRPDGSIDAFSIHVFLPAQRGVVPDRHGPWDARPGSTMTNAYVESEVAGKDGDTLKVKYKEGEKIVHVSPQTAIAVAAKGEKSELKAGAQIILFGWDKQPDGSILAKTLYVGRGLTPAM